MDKIFQDLPEGVHLESLLESLRRLCWGAADILLAYSRGEKPPFGFPKTLSVNNDGEGPVSAADLAVNSWLINGLNSTYPYCPWKVLSEESVKGKVKNEFDFDSEWVWILDPLDGTKDFLAKNGEYAIHLALVRKDRPVLGVVVIPEKEELWFGLVGSCAWCEDRKGRNNHVRFSDRKLIKDLIMVGSRNHRDLKLERLMQQINIGGSKKIGSVGCKIATILRGEADFYISLSGITAPKDWDMAAPEAILISAGGSFTHADGKLLNYKKDNFLQQGCLIASHGISHVEICQLISKEIRDIDHNYRV